MIAGIFSALLISGIVFVIIYFRSRVLESSHRAERALRKGFGLAGSVNTQSTFTGTWYGWFGRHFLFVFVSIVSFTLAKPAMFGWLQRWKANHTFINGKQLVYTGTAIDFIKTRLWWLLLTIITLGVHFILFRRVNELKFLAKYTKVVGEENLESSFNGTPTDNFVLSFSLLALVIITLGIALPFAKAIREQWVIDNTILSGKKLYSNMSGGQNMIKRIIWFLYSLLTFGFYRVFVQECAFEKFRVENLSFEKFPKDLEEDAQPTSTVDKENNVEDQKKTLKIAAIASGIVFGVLLLFTILSAAFTTNRNINVDVFETSNSITIFVDINFEFPEEGELRIWLQTPDGTTSTFREFDHIPTGAITFTGLPSSTWFIIEVTVLERIDYNSWHHLASTTIDVWTW